MKKFILLLVVAAFAASPLVVSTAEAGQGKHVKIVKITKHGKHAKHVAKHGKHHHGKHKTA